MAFSKLRSRLLSLFALWAGLMVVLGALTASRLQSMTGALESIYQDRLLCQVELRAIGEIYGTHIPSIVNHWREALIDGATATAQIAAAQKQAVQHWQRYKSSDDTADEKVLIPRAEPVLARAYAAASDARRLIAEADLGRVDSWLRLEAPVAFEPLVAAVDQLFALQGPAAEADVLEAEAAYRATLTGMLLLVSFAFVAGGAAAWALVVHYTGVARRKDRALRRMSAFYAARSRTNHLIVRAPDAATLLREVCMICTETDHALIATVYLVDGQRATCQAVAGPAADDFGELPRNFELDETAHRLSVTAAALSSGRPQVGLLLQGEGLTQAWQQSALRQNIQAVAAFPLRRDERLHGALTLYSAEADFFDADMVRLLSEMAGDLSYALDHLDREADGVLQQVQTQEALEAFQTLFKTSPVACEISTLEGSRLLEVNDAMAAMYGAVREGLVGLARGQLRRLLLEADAAAYHERLARDGQVHNLVAQIRLPDGRPATAVINAETIDYQGQPCVITMVLELTEQQTASAAV